MNPRELSILRTKLRDVNVEYSALVRAKSGEDRFVRMHELKAQRQALMELMASLRRAAGGPAASTVVVHQQPLVAANQNVS
jgi:hypothetical protein